MSERGPSVQLEQLWRERIGQWRSSGQSVRAYCAAEGIGEPKFYAWRRTLSERDGQTSPLGRKKPSKSKPAFVPVRLVMNCGIEVRCPSGHVVAFSNANIETLQQLFAALISEASC